MQVSNNKNVSAVIAAAGKGTRSKLNFPKCLFKIEDKEILGRILDALPSNLHSKNIIVSNDGYKPIASYISTLQNKDINLIIQENQLGMGNAILQLNDIKLTLAHHILLMWGDLPFISDESIENLLSYHFNNNNDFSFLTLMSKNVYTVVERDNLNNIQRVTESKELNDTKKIPSSGERDIGVFIFKRDIVLEYLQKDLDNKFGPKSGEHGFLYVIEHLVKDGFKVRGLETHNDIEGVSFNSLEDIKQFL